MRFHSSTHAYVHPGARYGRAGYCGGLVVLATRLVAPFVEGVAGLTASGAMVKRFGRVALVVVPVALVCNLICTSLINDSDARMVKMTEQYQNLEMINISLLARRARIWGPENMAKLAEKLDLYPASGRQIGVYDSSIDKFRYSKYSKQ
ncbi:hypothetical protein JWG39_01710 [Desulforhopalus vacuolatus]|uniref:hypothetical protein n=1 Tax=Desulforhopalus vacuolatus TaxID=40414 RepID=UPI001962A13C|nr:hypothetical protein [Desulforhopalus vacuolatus]MBM9518530.1 hypothetical protein [Desulforhopalus vacuolatus]